MADWNPALYRRFEDERTRPARELLGRVPLAQCKLAYDLGCGPGNSTELIVERFPQARVVGVDNSPAMLESARQRLPKTPFELADIAHWQPEQAPDLIYSNATLHWVPGHEALVARLFSLLAPGGVLAVQMPDNLDEPSHRLMREVAAIDTLRSHCTQTGQTGTRTELLGPGGYYDVLAPVAASVDVWRTTFNHPMASAAAIVEWVSSTGLKPFLEALDGDEARKAFLAEYERRIDAAYPARADGKRLLAFPRLFFVAVKK
ncbi:trans-aconitate 2-methyltransferase [Ramlibacter sp. PS4R-6]|uniref:trans-aconitate 2-methyltransferase n=1 Tax=Ramlibacter sp. PS4R-6 TaxID=3133438 RepID=UPI0030B7033C